MSGTRPRWGRDLAHRVGEVLRETSAEVIEPRFAALSSMDVRSKAVGELVTVADVEAERLLARRLTDLLRAAVVGEEACAGDPTLLAGLGSARAWLVDPLDGTTNFVEGNPDWAVMVALCVRGRTVASWIWQPTSQTMYIAEAGSGATRNGVTVTVTCTGRPSSRRPDGHFQPLLAPGLITELLLEILPEEEPRLRAASEGAWHSWLSKAHGKKPCGDLIVLAPPSPLISYAHRTFNGTGAGGATRYQLRPSRHTAAPDPRGR